VTAIQKTLKEVDFENQNKEYILQSLVEIMKLRKIVECYHISFVAVQVKHGGVVVLVVVVMVHTMYHVVRRSFVHTSVEFQMQ
jgi:hypothetical protein